MSSIETFLNVVGRYRHLIAIVIGVLFVGFLSDTSIVSLMKLDGIKSNLQAEVNYYRRQEKEAAAELEALRSSRFAVEKVARERYFMKYSDEDVFVLSTDLPAGKETFNHGYGQE
ncbi:MAG: septum formation initiator family protein [Prevotella sp.]|nr:septum formation initiator family protein [Prevotella sp.]